MSQPSSNAQAIVSCSVSLHAPNPFKMATPMVPPPPQLARPLHASGARLVAALQGVVNTTKRKLEDLQINHAEEMRKRVSLAEQSARRSATECKRQLSKGAQQMRTVEQQAAQEAALRIRAQVQLADCQQELAACRQQLADSREEVVTLLTELAECERILTSAHSRRRR